MKKTILAFLAVAFLSFGLAEEKSLSVKATATDWQKHINKLEYIRQIADESNLSNQQVKFITKTIDSLEILIIPQLRTQIDTTVKKK